MPIRSSIIVPRLWTAAMLGAALWAVSSRQSTVSSRRSAPAGRPGPALDSIFAAYDRSDVPGASVLVVRDGRVVVARSYGLADLERRTPATPATSYRLASLSKQFTAAAVLLLAREGRLRLDDPARDHLPELPAHARGVTIRHLLTHTSGLWAYEDFVPDTQTAQVKDRDVVRLLHRAESTYFAPGAAYRYSNTGYALLALVVEARSGARYADFLRERIFAPLGMASTVAYEAGVSTVPNRAYGYRAGRAGQPAFRLADQSSTSAVLGDGGVYSSIEDLATWDRALDDGTILDRATLEQAWTPATLADGSRTRYGFGWFVDRDSVTGGRRLSHHGETSGFTNFVLKLPERRLTVVVLTNRRGGSPWDLAARVAALPQFRTAGAAGRASDE